MTEFDTLIENTVIVEGTDKEAYRGSIGVIGDRVVATGQVKGDAKRIIDAKNLTALPGFVDAHSHADMTILWYPGCESYVMQGATTFVGGMCGGSWAPVGEHILLPRDIVRNYLNSLDPYKYYPNKPYYPLDQVNKWMKDLYGWTIDWKTMGDFFKKVERVGVSANYAPMLGHGTVRTKVMGLDYERHASEKEIEQIRELIVEGMEDGCLGLTAGLDYDPDVFASQEEMIDGVQILKKYNGVYHPHWRRTGRRRDVALGHVPNEKIGALMECVDVHKKTGVRLHFAHLNAGWDIYPKPPEELEAANIRVTIDMIMRESKGGLDITWNAIPFMVRGARTEGGATPYLCSLLEPWLRELGNREALAKWLKVKEFRDEVKEAIQHGKWYIRGEFNPNTNPKWANNIVILKSRSPGADGKSLAEIAQSRKTDAWTAWFDLIAEDSETRGVCSPWPMECYNAYLTHAAGMVGLDTDVADDKFQGKEPPYLVRGINTYSAYPIFYNKLVREKKIMTLEEAVQKTATMPARVHNLEGRGVLCQGSYADIVLMDLPNLQVLSDELESRRYPKGIEYVFVNGVSVVDKNKHTGARPGRVLKRAK
jgi:N-acyl-D-amino-acid deacylase